jgi:hypothetical protein
MELIEMRKNFVVRHPRLPCPAVIKAESEFHAKLRGTFAVAVRLGWACEAEEEVSVECTDEFPADALYLNDDCFGSIATMLAPLKLSYQPGNGRCEDLAQAIQHGTSDRVVVTHAVSSQ